MPQRGKGLHQTRRETVGDSRRADPATDRTGKALDNKRDCQRLPQRGQELHQRRRETATERTGTAPEKKRDCHREEETRG